MRENTMPTTTLAIEDSSTMNPPNGLIAIAARPEKDAGNAEQRNQGDDQPVESLDDGGRDEAVPLEQIPKFKHRSTPPANRISSYVSSTGLPAAQGLAPNAAPGKIGRPEGDAARRARAMRAGG